MEMINLCFESAAIFFVFTLAKFGAFLCTFWALRSYFWGWGQVQKLLLGPTKIDNQLWFWKYSPIFLFIIFPHLGPLLHFFGALQFFFGSLGLFFGAIFGVGVKFKKHFWSLLMLTINFGFGSTALSFCFEFSQIWGHFWAF